MYFDKCSLKLHVVVDNVSIKNDMIPAHGLSLLLEIQSHRALLRILFGLGPSRSILINNLMILGYRLSDIDTIILPMNSRGLVGSLREIIREISSTTLISSPSIRIDSLVKNMIKIFNTTRLTNCCLLLPPLGPRGELVLAINTKSGFVLIIPCSHVGIVNIIKHTVKELKVRNIYGIIGGLHLSVYDILTFNDFKSLSEKLGVQTVIPLYCTGIKARNKVLKLSKECCAHVIEVGCGLQLIIE